ncbi:MAG: nicotinate-nucleotide--dimethylbenzimidazole phosphoribosyltransferase [Pseudomonadota bacterium]
MTIFDNVTTFQELLSRSSQLPGPDEAARLAAEKRQLELTKPPGSLGELERIAGFMASWQASARPEITRAQALVFAGNHGICAQGVNPFPQEVTAQMVANFNAGGAAINQLCKAAGADLSVIALDLDRPTVDFTEGPAMAETEVLKAMAAGAGAVDPEADILILGEMGIGNSTVAAALAAGRFGGPAADWTGPGTGLDADGVSRKARAVEAGLGRHKGASGLALFTAFGGREQAAIAGAVLEARANRIPVILDGFIATAAVLPVHGVDPGLLDHCLIGHQSREPGHGRMLDKLGKPAILTLDMALGEGSGAALALSIVRAALACHNGMATFAEAGVSGP